MKRRSVTFCVLVVFVTWNVTTYLFLAYNKPQDGKSQANSAGTRDAVLIKQLAELQQRLKDQVAAHQQILGQLQEARKELQGGLLQKENHVGSLDEQLAQLELQLQQQLLSNHELMVQLRRFQDGARAFQLDPLLEQSLKADVNDDLFEDVDLRDLGAALPDDPVAASVLPSKEPALQHAPVDDVNLDSVVIPVLVIACNRPSINRNLDQLLKYRPSAERFPIVVSQDCGHGPTAEMIRSYGDKVKHIQHPDLTDIRLPKKEEKFKGYYKIARHYKWALTQIFHELMYDAVIIVEDDLDISPDFYEYFAATFRILHTDPSLWCVSAWNDNGKETMVATDPELLYRTDFFPGLGWMLEKSVWLELESTWPTTFWDDWMRHPDQRKDRSCIRPEVPRTSTFGKVGVSKGQYFEKHLKFIKHNMNAVPFTQKDLSYLQKDIYDDHYVHDVYSAPLMSIRQVIIGDSPDIKVVRVQYSDKVSFKTQAKQLGLMDDFKSGVPRTGYRGIVSFLYRGRRVHFAPPPNWRGYDPTWS